MHEWNAHLRSARQLEGPWMLCSELELYSMGNSNPWRFVAGRWCGQTGPHWPEERVMGGEGDTGDWWEQCSRCESTWARWGSQYCTERDKLERHLGGRTGRTWPPRDVSGWQLPCCWAGSLPMKEMIRLVTRGEATSSLEAPGHCSHWECWPCCPFSSAGSRGAHSQSGAWWAVHRKSSYKRGLRFPVGARGLQQERTALLADGKGQKSL